MRRADVVSWACRLGTLALAFVGSALSLAFLSTTVGLGGIAFAGGLITLLYAALPLARENRKARRWTGRAAWGILAVLHAGWLYLALAWAFLLGWTTTTLAWAPAAVAAGLVVASWRHVWRVPVVLPLGLASLACLQGWQREEASIRCDDYAAVLHDPDVRVLVPTSASMAQCVPGGVVAGGRYPRFVVEAADGHRVFIATQPAANGTPTLAAGRTFDGSLCEANRFDGSHVRCVGAGKAQDIVEFDDRLYAAAWGQADPHHRGAIYELSATSPITILRTLPTEDNAGDLFDDPADGVLWSMTDEGFEVLPVRSSTFEAEAPIPVPFLPPGSFHYDPVRHEGVLCGAFPGAQAWTGFRGYRAIAVRGHPFGFRPLGTSGPLSWLALSWGCDWDPDRRLAYAALPNLGVVSTLDYDSGRTLRSDVVELGLRSVTLDARRGLLYMTNFLRGELVAIDRDSGREQRRWHVGRFARTATLSRDGDLLYVASNLGVVTVRLGPTAP